MHKIGKKLKLLYFLNFDLVRGEASAPLAPLVAPLVTGTFYFEKRLFSEKLVK